MSLRTHTATTKAESTRALKISRGKCVHPFARLHGNGHLILVCEFHNGEGLLHLTPGERE